MTGSLPELIDPLEFVEKRRRIQGTLPLSRMERMGSVVLNPDAWVELDLTFGREDRWPVVTGHIKAQLVLECQCCLEPLTWPVENDLRLGIVSSIDEGNRLPDSLEPLLLADDAMVALSDLVEDELLLAIPPIPQHTNCTLKTEHSSESSRSAFAVLAQLQGKI